MLLQLGVQDFVLIDSLELELEPGYNVLTGETGAGKSIVVGALALALGGRARADVVRSGCREACVEASFDVSQNVAAAELLDSMGIASDGELVIRRVIQASGRSRAYLNGRLCAVSELATLARDLADITSQHESVALADSSRHLAYLDRYAGLGARKTQLGAWVNELLALHGELAALRDKEASRAERESYLRFRLEAIERLAPEPDELDELRADLGRLKHAERLREAGQRVAGALGRDGSGVCDQVGKLVGELNAVTDLDASLDPLAGELDALWEQLREVAVACERYAERIEADPQRLELVQERVFALEGLLRQHGPTLRDVLDAQRRMQAELDELAQVDTRLPVLLHEQSELLSRCGRQARQLSKRRHEAASRLADAISEQLAELGMGAARVVVEVGPSETGPEGSLVVDGARLGREGIDRVQFLIAPNRGVEPRPLGRIASGGELSRALLALKRALGRVGDETQSIQVFDEVDAGIGGDTADRIGRAISAIAQGRQVLCITHLASIAAYADAHFVVEKRHGEDRSISMIRRVEGRDRVAELARMLTGAKACRSSAKAARELLAGATRSRPAAA